MWVRRDAYPSVFHARGWMTGLGIAGLVAAGVLVLSPLLIEPQVEQAAQVRLASLGFELQELRAQGQDLDIVVMGGPGTDNQIAESAQAIAQTTRCDLLGVQLPCAEQVRVQLAAGLAAGTPPASPPEAVGQAPAREGEPIADKKVDAPAAESPKASSPTEPVDPAPKSAEPAAPEAADQSGLSAEQLHCQAELTKLMKQDSIQFRTASTRILHASYKHVEKLAQKAAQCPGYIVVVGHTDNVGKPHANAWLSRVRAKAVRRALISRGLPEQKVFAQGKGADEPIASNDTPSGRAQNRRIEFRVVATAPSVPESTGQ